MVALKSLIVMLRIITSKLFLSIYHYNYEKHTCPKNAVSITAACRSLEMNLPQTDNCQLVIANRLKKGGFGNLSGENHSSAFQH